jgi:phosphate transport system substrate-binding protein
MRYIACDGQAEMGRGVKGYAPLPPNLSQEMANSVARMTGRPAERLTRANCGNPRFDPNFRLPEGPPPPDLPPIDAGAGGGGTATDGTTAGSEAGASDSTASSAATATTVSGQSEVAAGVAGEDAIAVGGGSTDWRETDPTSYTRPGLSPIEIWAWVAVIAMLVVPLLGGIVWGVLRRQRP